MSKINIFHSFKMSIGIKKYTDLNGFYYIMDFTFHMYAAMYNITIFF
jgi:hypothetical protein